MGYIVRGPIGGLTWHYLQYVTGLAQMGHEVYYVEDSCDYPSCYDPSRQVTDTDPSYGLRYAKRVFNRAGLDERWAYYDAHRSLWCGPLGERIVGLCGNADVVINVSGLNPLRSWITEIPVRLLIDTDPVFTQIRHNTDSAARNLALQHTSFLSFAENTEHRDTLVPNDGLPWKATRQPIVIDAWHVTPGRLGGRFTSIMQWESYPALLFEGQRYGMKSDSFGPYVNLPNLAGRSFELALGSQTAPRSLLRRKGWFVRNPLRVTRDPYIYQRYIQQSKAEFSIAKHGYVFTRCGWFSERSAAYLASGRPVLTQETGFSDWLSAGDGVIAFTSPEEALAGIDRINSRYDFHCVKAREIAKEYFDSNKVLSSVIERAMTESW
jgi:hypothetical protein